MQRELQTNDITADTLKKSFKMIYTSTIATKIRSFQYRQLHRSIGINCKLHEWGIRESSLCDLCNRQTETYHHLFYSCEKVKRLWNSAKEWTRQKTGYQLDISPTTTIFGTNHSPVQDLIINCTKMYIYSCKMNKTEPREETLYRKLEETKSTEKYIAVKNNKLPGFKKKWNLQEELQ
jgi:hypothetical protein